MTMRVLAKARSTFWRVVDWDRTRGLGSGFKEGVENKLG